MRFLNSISIFCGTYYNRKQELTEHNDRNRCPSTVEPLKICFVRVCMERLRGVCAVDSL